MIAAALIAMAAAPACAAALPDGVAADLVYTGELWRNLRGGLERGGAYLDNVDATLALDADTLWGWRDTRLFVYGLYNNGASLSKRTGDLQVVSNIETGVRAARIYEAWVETGLGERGSLRAGLYDVNSEFDVLDTANLFVHSAHGIGSNIGLSGRNGPSIFPVTSLGVRLDWDWNGPWHGRLAVLDGVPGDPEDPAATAIELSSNDGALLIGELERNRGRGRLLLGAWGYTAAFDEWPQPTAGARPRSRGNGGVYLRGETALGAADSGFRAFARAGLASPQYNPFGEFFSAGLTWAGAIRTGDALGVALAWGEAASRYRRTLEANPAHREIALELTYRLPLHPRVTVQPDLQYLIAPGLRGTVENAWTVGVRLMIDVY